MDGLNDSSELPQTYKLPGHDQFTQNTDLLASSWALNQPLADSGRPPMGLTRPDGETMQDSLMSENTNGDQQDWLDEFFSVVGRAMARIGLTSVVWR